MKTSQVVRRQSAKVTVKNANDKFAEGLCFRKLFFIFLIGSVLGAIYEDLLVYFRTLITTGEGEWMLHRAVIYGPFNLVYGVGAAVMCWLLLRKKYSDWQIFLYAALLGGTIEYVLSFLQEFFTNTRSWDYSSQPLNIAGRTTIPFMLFWGLLGLLLVKYVYPFCSMLIEKIPAKVGNSLFWVLLIFMICNCVVSFSAVMRQTFRRNGIDPVTPIGEFYDEYYSDEFLRKYYPNMVPMK